MATSPAPGPPVANASVRAFVGKIGAEPLAVDLLAALDLGVPFRTLGGTALEIATADHSAVQPPGAQADAQAARPAGLPSMLYVGRPFYEDRLPEPFRTMDRPTRDALDGKYAFVANLAVEDPAARPGAAAIELGVDFLGAGALYLSRRADTVYFASHLGLLMRVLPGPCTTNQLGIAAQLICGGQLFAETHFTGVTRLTAGARVSVLCDPRAGGVLALHERTTETPRSLVDVSVPAYSARALRGWIDRGVDRERLTEHDALFLSAGKDSYALTLSAMRAASLPMTVTYGEAYSHNQVSGVRRARELGLVSHAVPYSKWTLASYARETIGLGGGAAGLQTAHCLVGSDWARAFASRAVVGLYGGALSGSLLGRDEEVSERDIFRVLAPYHDNPILREAYPAERAEILDHLRGRFADLSREVGGKRALLILDLGGRQARWISTTFDLCSWFLPTVTPFVQRDLTAAALQADPSLLHRQCTYRAVIAEMVEQTPRRRPLRHRIPPRLDTRLHGWVRGRRAVPQADWKRVLARSSSLAAEPDCGDARLDRTRRLTWPPATPRKDAGVVVASLAAALSMAIRRFQK